MADIFQEVDEELRRERLRQVWERYGAYIVAVALLIVIGVGGWRGYEWWHARQAAAAGAVFEQAVLLASQDKHDEAQAAFASIASQPGAYRTLAGLREAAELARKDRDGAVKIYEQVAADPASTRTLHDLALVRAGLLLVDSASYETMRSKLEPLAAADAPFRHTARELLAMSAWRNGDKTATKQWIDAIMSDDSTPPGTRARAEMLLALGDAGAKS